MNFQGGKSYWSGSRSQQKREYNKEREVHGGSLLETQIGKIAITRGVQHNRGSTRDKNTNTNLQKESWGHFRTQGNVEGNKNEEKIWGNATNREEF